MNSIRYHTTKKVNGINALVTLILAIVKTIGGAVGQSPALFADGIHSFSDLLVNLLVVFANHYAHIGPDHNHPYGHRRFETFATLVLGIFLLIVAFSLAYHGVMHILNASNVKPDTITVWLAMVVVLTNEGLFRYTLAAANKVNSSLLKANAYHSRADSLSSLIVLLGILGELAGLRFADPIAAILVAGFIARVAIQLAWQAIYELTDASLPEEEVKAMKKIILHTPGVRHMHRLRTRKMSDRIFLDVHLLIAPYTSASEGHYIAEVVRKTLMTQYADLEDVTIHVDTEDHPETIPDTLLPSRQEILGQLNPLLEAALGPNQVLETQFFYWQKYIEIKIILNPGVDQTALSALKVRLQECCPLLRAIHFYIAIFHA